MGPDRGEVRRRIPSSSARRTGPCVPRSPRPGRAWRTAPDPRTPSRCPAPASGSHRPGLRCGGPRPWRPGGTLRPAGAGPRPPGRRRRPRAACAQAALVAVDQEPGIHVAPGAVLGIGRPGHTPDVGPSPPAGRPPAAPRPAPRPDRAAGQGRSAATIAAPATATAARMRVISAGSFRARTARIRSSAGTSWPRGEPPGHALEPGRPGVDADPRRRGETGDGRQRAGQDRPVPGHPVEVRERNLGRHPSSQLDSRWIDRARLHQHARGAEGPATGGPQRACAGGIGDGVTAPEHERIEPDRGHGVEHPSRRAARSSASSVVGVGVGRSRARSGPHANGG